MINPKLTGRYLTDIARLLLFLFIQLLIENSIQYLFGDINIHLSFSFLFIINLCLYLRLNNFKIFFIFQLFTIAAYVIIMLPHFYYFNLFSFYSRVRYLFSTPVKFLIYFLLLILVFYLISALQFSILQSIYKKRLLLLIFLFFMLITEMIFAPFIFHFNSKKIEVTFINQNRASEYCTDYKRFVNGREIISNYVCKSCNNISPSIKYLLNNTDNRELLIIVESWGELIDPTAQDTCACYIKSLFNSDAYTVNKNYQVTYGRTCFNGNTSSAEGRELLNINDEESYRAFLENDVSSKFNLVNYKNQNGFYTICGFSASKKYGSNWGNAEEFRKKLGFKSRFYFEELRLKNKINQENWYDAVDDEAMIDSLVNESKKCKRVFAYGLTINTHTPFKLDLNNSNLNYYNQIKSRFLYCFHNNLNAFNQFYRISEIINHTFNKLNTNNGLFDKIIIVGDHSNPEFGSRDLYNKKMVPYILIEKI